MAIIPPSMTKGDEVFAAYMGPYRERNGEHRLILTIHSAATGRMIAHAEIMVASRDSGNALADALNAVITKEVPPPIHSATDFDDHN